MAQGILSLAKQGDPRAIAALMNHSTKPQGITVQVARQGNCLHVLFESKGIPNQQDTVALVRNSMRILKVEPIQTINIYGRQTGETSVAWSQTISLQPSPEPAVSLSTANRTTEDGARDDARDEVTDGTTTAPTVSESIAPATAPQVRFLPAKQPDKAALAPQPQEASDESSSSDVPITPTVLEPASDRQDSSDTQEWLRRPEAVVLIIFATVLLLWQLYVDLLESAERTALSARELAERLGTNQSTISRRKDRADFSDWTQRLDPDGIAWIYQNQKFVPRLGSDHAVSYPIA